MRERERKRERKREKEREGDQVSHPRKIFFCYNRREKSVVKSILHCLHRA